MPAALIPGLDIAWIEPQRDREILDRVVGPVEAHQHAAAVIARFGEVRRNRQRAVIAGERLVEAVKRLQHRAAVVVRLEIIRLQRQRAVEALERLVITAERALALQPNY